MDRFAAHYIYTGKNVLRKAVLAQDKSKKIVSLSDEDAMAIEYSNTIFFNGIICPQFCPLNDAGEGSGFVVLDCQNEIPTQKLDPDKLAIKYNAGDEKRLFSFFTKLQEAFEYSLFELLKIVCENNYKAQNKPVPIIEIGQSVNLILLTKLDLLGAKFRPNSYARKLNR